MPSTNDALHVLLLMAPGFIAFRIFMIDRNWKELSQLDVFYGSLVFSAFGYLAYLLFVSHVAWAATDTGPLPTITMLLVTTTGAIVGALLWKAQGHTRLYELLRWLQLTNEDGRGNVWDKIFNDPAVRVSQITAYMKDGGAIQCDDTAAFETEEFRKHGIHSYYTHRDGQLGFIFNLRKSRDSDEWKPVEDVHVGGQWGIRVVYINPSELQRLELRVVPTKEQR